MTDVRVRFDNPSDQAVLLLEAAEKAGEKPTVVRTETGAFVAPEEIAKSAGVDYEAIDDSEPELVSAVIESVEVPQVAPADQRMPLVAEHVEGSDGDADLSGVSDADAAAVTDAEQFDPGSNLVPGEAEKPAAKKAAAKKTAARKSTAKKSAAKKSTARKA